MDIENDEELYGAGFPLLEKLKLLAEWAPLLAQLQAVGQAKTPHEQAVAFVQTLQWAAGKSATKIDDEALFHVEAVLKTAEAQRAVAWVSSKLPGGEA